MQNYPPPPYSNLPPPSYEQAIQSTTSEFPTPVDTQKLVSWFRAVDNDNSGNITPKELAEALSKGGMHFNEDVCKKMVRMFDADRNGTIDEQEFCQLHNYLTAMKVGFERADKDKSGSLDYNEVAQALRVSGVNVDQRVMYRLFLHYAEKNTARVTYGGFIDMCIFVGTVRQLFTKSDTKRVGLATLDFDAILSNFTIFL